MTAREKLCLRILLFVARRLAPLEWRHDISALDLQLSVYMKDLPEHLTRDFIVETILTDHKEHGPIAQVFTPGVNL